MAPAPARFQIDEVVTVDATGVTYRQYGAERHLAIEDLSNAELNRALAIAMPEVNGKAWFGVAKETKAEAMRTGVAPVEATLEAKVEEAERTSCITCGNTWRERDEAGICTKCREDEAERKADEVAEAKAKAKAGHDEWKADEAKAPSDVPSIDEAIKRLVESAAGASLDEAKVRKIASDVLSESVADILNEVSRPQVNVYKFADKPDITVEGRVHNVMLSVLQSLGIGHHVWLVGPAGTGKSTIAKNAAEAMGLPFYSISCHGQMTAAQVFGYLNVQGDYIPSLFRIAYEQGGVFLFDEVDSASSNVLAAVNQALANGHCAFPDGMVAKSDTFYCLGAGNTFGKGATAEYSGRAKIDEATIDRFDYQWVDYDRAIESDIVLAILPDKGAELIAEYERYRTNAENAGLKVILGSRGLIGTAELMAAGATKADAMAKRIWRGMGADVRRKIEGK